jgi:preprotein translocase subunit SecE
MENRKIIVSIYISAGILAWFLSRASILYLTSAYYMFGRIPGIHVGSEVVPAILGLATFFILFRHPKVNEVLEEVVSELKKVTWPGREDVVRSTYVVMVCIVLASIFLAAFDLLWGKVIGVLLG